MTGFDLISVVQSANEIIKQAREARDHHSRVLEQIPEEYREEARRTTKRMVRRLVLPIVLVPFLFASVVFFVAYFRNGEALEPALWRSLLGLALFPVTVIAGAGLGAGFAILPTREWFLASSLGEHWRGLCGANDVKRCRSTALMTTVVCLFALLVFLQLVMGAAPFSDGNA